MQPLSTARVNSGRRKSVYKILSFMWEPSISREDEGEGDKMSDPKIGDVYLTVGNPGVDWKGGASSTVQGCGVCGGWNTIETSEDFPEDKIMICKCREVKG